MNLLFVGTFDPITYGHLDIIRRAAHLADILYVGVGSNSDKRTLFTADERIVLAREACKQIKNARVFEAEGLTSDLAISLSAVLVRGLRDVSDFCYEKQMDEVNKNINWGNETIYLMGGTESAISSSAVRALWRAGASEYRLNSFCPPCVVEALLRKRSLSGSADPTDADRVAAYQEYLCKLTAAVEPINK